MDVETTGASAKTAAQDGLGYTGKVYSNTDKHSS